jgi:hypothetical protein
MKATFYAAAILAVSVLCAQVASNRGGGNLPLHTAKPEDLYGDWVGYDGSCLKFYRLRLQQAGTGECRVLFNEDLSGIYNVKWHVKAGEILLELSPTSAQAEPIIIEVCSADPMRIEVIVKGIKRSWQRKACLYREEEFLKRLRLTETHQPKPAKKGNQ